MPFETICVVGLGYIGLPTAAVLASRGKQVVGVDVRPSVVEAINRGEVHIVEANLDEMVSAVVAAGSLSAALAPQQADAFILAVPTPFDVDLNPDLSYIHAASRAVASVLKKGDLVVIESTSPVGTTLQVARWLSDLRPDLRFPHEHGEAADIRLAYCPERVLPGHVLKELVANDRVIGGMTDACAAAAIDLYRIFVEGDCVATTAETAEMCKLVENSFRDVNIAFANELSLVCDKLGINVWDVIRVANRHPRVNILQPGPGVGGHCIAVDPWFIVSSAPETARLIRTAREVNDAKPHWVVAKVGAAVDEARREGNSASVTIAVLGLAFKPDIDDLRESPSLAIAKELGRIENAKLLFVEPYVAALPAALEGAGILVDAVHAVTEADVVVLLVDHSAFKNLDQALLDGKRLIDTRGLWVK